MTLCAGYVAQACIASPRRGRPPGTPPRVSLTTRKKEMGVGVGVYPSEVGPAMPLPVLSPPLPGAWQIVELAQPDASARQYTPDRVMRRSPCRVAQQAQHLVQRLPASYVIHCQCSFCHSALMSPWNVTLQLGGRDSASLSVRFPR